jgi:hypothetical protein
MDLTAFKKNEKRRMDSIQYHLKKNKQKKLSRRKERTTPSRSSTK